MLASSITLLVDKHGAKIQARITSYTVPVGRIRRRFVPAMLCFFMNRRASYALGIFRAGGGSAARSFIVRRLGYS